MAVPSYDIRIDWNGDGDYTDTGEDVTRRVLSRSGLSVEYGRDQARALSPSRPGESRLELNNQSRDYSPENAASPLAGRLGPGRAIRVQATHLAVTRTLFQGYLDAFDLLPDRERRSVQLSAIDGLGRVGDLDISTPAIQGLRTGTAIGYILDEVGWTGGRDLDAGATTLRWWWEEGTSARDALNRVLAAEGPPAFMYIGPAGEFVFRDRHHRISRTASTAVQATFRDTGTEPLISGMEYDAGWRDVVNHVVVEVAERTAKLEPEVVWSLTEQLSFTPGQTRTVDILASGPVASWVTPTQDDTPETEPDFVVVGGDLLTFFFERAAGQSTQMRMTLPLGASPVTVLSGQVRGHLLTEAKRVKVSAEDAASIGTHGRRTYKVEAPHIGVHDALAVAEVILSMRASRLPVITMTIIGGGNNTRLTQQLDRDFSDRVRVIDAETGLDGEFFIDRIAHSVTEAGRVLTTTFGCEKAPTIPSNLFRFNTTGKGFNDGTFAASGVDDPTNVFRFDTAGHGFDDGLLAN